MGDHKSGPAEGIKGVVEGVKGKAKEAAGAVTGRDDLVREGEAQQDKADAQRDAAKLRRKPKRSPRARVPRRPRSAKSDTSNSFHEMGSVRVHAGPSHHNLGLSTASEIPSSNTDFDVLLECRACPGSGLPAMNRRKRGLCG